MADSREKVLEVRDLNVTFHARGQEIRAVRGVNLDVYPGEILGIVGESGSGKSVTMKAVLGILPENASVKAGSLKLRSTEMTSLSEEEYRRLRGKDMTMIFQDPMTALDPVMTVGKHMEEVLKRNLGLKNKEEIRQKSIEMLDKVGIPDPPSRLKQYPHEFSGGMRQRVLIAMALACGPKLLIADEPTTALDVTIQAQILDLLQELEEQYHTSIVLITHDMGVVAEMADHVLVMYAGKSVEYGTAEQIFDHPLHPYTIGLLDSIPKLGSGQEEHLHTIEGTVPGLDEMPVGCRFCTRCPHATETCRQQDPGMRVLEDGHKVRCLLYENGGSKDTGKEGGR